MEIILGKNGKQSSLPCKVIAKGHDGMEFNGLIILDKINFYFLSNNPSYDGNKPSGMSRKIMDTSGYRYSWQIGSYIEKNTKMYVKIDISSIQNEINVIELLEKGPTKIPFENGSSMTIENKEGVLVLKNDEDRVIFSLKIDVFNKIKNYI